MWDGLSSPFISGSLPLECWRLIKQGIGHEFHELTRIFVGVNRLLTLASSQEILSFWKFCSETRPLEQNWWNDRNGDALRGIGRRSIGA